MAKKGRRASRGSSGSPETSPQKTKAEDQDALLLKMLNERWGSKGKGKAKEEDILDLEELLGSDSEQEDASSSQGQSRAGGNDAHSTGRASSSTARRRPSSSSAAPTAAESPPGPPPIDPFAPPLDDFSYEKAVSSARWCRETLLDFRWHFVWLLVAIVAVKTTEWLLPYVLGGVGWTLVKLGRGTVWTLRWTLVMVRWVVYLGGIGLILAAGVLAAAWGYFLREARLSEKKEVT